MNVHGEHNPSLPQKLFLAVHHLLAVVLTAWLLFGSGFGSFSVWMDVELEAGSLLRRILLMVASAVYFGRLCFTGYFLQRKMAWGESATVSVLLYVFHLSFAFLGGTNATPIGVVGIGGCELYVAGSYLNTASEYRRYLWKQKPENHGELYTGGLFRYAMHINYFGDALLFTGFALMTGSGWALVIPGVVTASFVFFHIPSLDAHLRDRYGSSFEDYASKTDKFIPGIY